MEQSNKTTHLIEAIRDLKELQDSCHIIVHKEIQNLVNELMQEMSK